MEIGSVIDGKYRIIRLLGEGGMGSVYEGINVLIERRVAIKVLHRSASARDPKLVQRFQREAQAAGKIGNDHILEVLDLGVLAGDTFIVMEYLDGEPLGERLSRKRTLSPTELKPILEQALEGLRAAHKAGIIHRDLKPDNLFILKEKAGIRDFVKIIDFGISKFSGLEESMRMTKTGALLGTPYYMSPEQARGADQVTPTSDLYSLGVIAYEALTGHRPYDGATYNELLFKIVMSDATPLETLSPKLDRDFGAIVAKAMRRDPAERYQNADEFLKALSNYKDLSGTMDFGTPGPLLDPNALLAEKRRLREENVAQVRKKSREEVSPDEEKADDLPSILPLEKSPRWLPYAGGFVALLVVFGLFSMCRSGRDSDAPAEPTALPIPPTPAGDVTSVTPTNPPAPVVSAAPPANASKLESKTETEPKAPKRIEAEKPSQKPKEPEPPVIMKPPEPAFPSVVPAKPAKSADPDFGY